MNILVTGGAGFIGSHIVEALIRENISSEIVVVADVLTMGQVSNLDGLVSKQVNIVNLDVTDYPRLSQLIAKHTIDTVIHTAVTPLVYSLVEPVIGFQQIVTMQQNLLECLRKGLYGRLIAFSTSEVYGGTFDGKTITEESILNPATPYAAAKAAADLLSCSYINSFSANVSILRPFNNYGPRKLVLKQAGIIPTTIRKFAVGQPVQLFGGGQTTRDFVYVEDTARAVLAMLRSETTTRGHIVQIASGISRSMREVVTDIAEMMGMQPLIDEYPARQGDVQKLRGCGAKAERLMNFRPDTEWHTGLQRCIEYYS